MIKVYFLILSMVWCCWSAADDIGGISKSAIVPDPITNNVQLYLGLHAVKLEQLRALRKERKILASFSNYLVSKVEAKENSYTLDAGGTLCNAMAELINVEPNLANIKKTIVIYYKNDRIIKYALGSWDFPTCDAALVLEAGDVLVFHYLEWH